MILRSANEDLGSRLYCTQTLTCTLSGNIGELFEKREGVGIVWVYDIQPVARLFGGLRGAAGGERQHVVTATGRYWGSFL